MANNKRIQILRGRNIKDNATELMAGQPVYDTEKNILRVGKGGETIANTKPLNVEGTAVLGTTTGTTDTTDRQPDHIFEANSNTVKQATNAINAISKENVPMYGFKITQLYTHLPYDRLCLDIDDLYTYYNRVIWNKDILATITTKPSGVRSTANNKLINIDLSNLSEFTTGYHNYKFECDTKITSPMEMHYFFTFDLPGYGNSYSPVYIYTTNNKGVTAYFAGIARLITDGSTTGSKTLQISLLNDIEFSEDSQITITKLYKIYN